MTAPGGPDGFDATLPEESLEELYEHAPCGYVSTLPDGTFARINQTFLDWTGYARDELLGRKRLQDLLTVGGRIFYETHYMPLLHMQGVVSEVAFDLIGHDGRHLPILINTVQRRDASGDPLINRTTIFNATDRRAYEQELLLGRKRTEQAADRMARLQVVMASLAEALTPAQVAEIITQQGVGALGAQAGLVAVVAEDGGNLKLVHAIGYPPDMLENWQRFPLDAPMPLAEAARTGETILLESPEVLAARYPQLAPTSARTGNSSVAATPLLIDGRVIGVLGLSFAAAQTFTAEDRAFLLTLARQCALALERARLYEAERSARAEAQEALRVRDAFLSIAAHELKNPLTSLLGNAQLLQRRTARTSSDRDRQTIATIVDQAARLARMITELLDVSHMEAGQLSIEPAPLDLPALVGRIVEDMQPTLTQHALTFRAPTGSLMIDGDALRLEQVVQNLLQNAIKYTPGGGTITVRVEQHGQMGCIVVSDPGIGIPAEALPRLFQRFYRAANVEQGGIGGLGIGLYVVKEIVTLHSGTITVESAEGAGSTFTVCLPLAQAEQRDQRSAG